MLTRDHGILPASCVFIHIYWVMLFLLTMHNLSSHLAKGTWLSWPRWLVTHWDGLPTCGWSAIPVLTRPGTMTLLMCQVPLPIYQTPKEEVQWVTELRPAFWYRIQHAAICSFEPATFDVWPVDVMVGILDVQVGGHGFNSWLFRCQIALQVVHTHVPLVTKQYNLALVKRQRCTTAGKVTVVWCCTGRASQIKVVYPTTGLRHK